MSLKKCATVLAAASAAGLMLAGCSSSGSQPAATPAPQTVATSAAADGWLAPTGTWGLPPDMTAAAKRASLPMLSQEMLQVHYHAHLDVIADGSPVTVPAFIGIDNNLGTITALHTHQPDGIIHIESAANIPFKLGQVFTEWGQSLSSTQVGPVSLGTDKVLRVYVNGKEVTTDPTQIVLHSHDEIVVWVGAKGTTPQVPASYAWNLQNYPQ
jgi:hypothetical protein